MQKKTTSLHCLYNYYVPSCLVVVPDQLLPYILVAANLGLNCWEKMFDDIMGSDVMSNAMQPAAPPSPFFEPKWPLHLR